MAGLGHFLLTSEYVKHTSVCSEQLFSRWSNNDSGCASSQQAELEGHVMLQ